MKKISVGIISWVGALDYIYSILNTWGKDFDDSINIMCGNVPIGINLPPEVISIDVEDDGYNGLNEQQFKTLEYLYYNNTAEWYYLAGQDTFLYREHAEKMLDKYDYNQKLLVGGHYGFMTTRFKKEYQSELKHKLFVSGGPGFFLSHSLVGDILKDQYKFSKEWEEITKYKTISNIYYACDMAICYMISQYYNIPVVVEEGFYHLHFSQYPHTNDEFGTLHLIDKPIGYHKIKPDEMKRLYANKLIGVFK